MVTLPESIALEQDLKLHVNPVIPVPLGFTVNVNSPKFAIAFQSPARVSGGALGPQADVSNMMINKPPSNPDNFLPFIDSLLVL